MTSPEFIHDDTEIVSDADCILILNALKDINWGKQRSPEYRDWKTQVKVKLPDAETGREYYLSTDEKFLNTDLHVPRNIPEHTDPVFGRVPLVMLEQADLGWGSDFKEAECLYNGTWKEEGVKMERRSGASFSVRFDMSLGQQREFSSKVFSLLGLES